ncbi:MAG: hypothetical protein PHR11_04295 [Candidatus Omnitrophica bacterium]|nr:hypothetical protein [Candidatus Omnitrophota bacterium]
MKKLFLLLLEGAFLAGVVALAYFNYNQERLSGYQPQRLLMLSDRKHMLGEELEDKLVFYLAKQLGIYEGQFEIVDVVNLGTGEIVGVDYILVTIKISGGKLCQVTLFRQAGPWAQWELDEGSFSMVDLPRSELYTYLDGATWMKELGISAEQISQYMAAHPELSTGADFEAAFKDKKSGIYTLPSDWWQVVRLESGFKLDVKKEKMMRLIAEGKQDPGEAYWKVDYASEYSGPGYRAYLYEKVKSERK